jgi:hypothetical protein
MRIAIDADGTILERSPPLRLRPGARHALWSLRRAGHWLILHSSRLCCPVADEITTLESSSSGKISSRVTLSIEDYWARQAELRRFLQSHRLWRVEEGGVFNQIWDLPGKPHADLSLDDRAVDPDWGEVRLRFGWAGFGLG